MNVWRAQALMARDVPHLRTARVIVNVTLSSDMLDVFPL